MGQSPSIRRKGLATNFSLLSIATLVQNVLGFVTVIYLARILGPTGYGYYSYTWSWILLFLSLTQLGIPGWATRAAASLQGKERIDKIQEAWSVLFWLGLVSTGLFLSITMALPMPSPTKLLLVLWSSLLWQNTINPSWIYALDQKMIMPSLGIIVGAFLRLAGTVLLVRAHDQVTLAVVVTVLALWATVVLPLMGLGVRNRLIWPRWPGWQTARHTISHSAVFATMGMVSTLYTYVDVLILRHFSNLTQVGFYSVAQRPTVFLWAFVIAFLHIFYPAAGRMAQENLNKFESLISNILRMILLLVMPIVVGTVVVARPMVVGLFGRVYQASTWPMTLLIVAMAIAGIREIFAISLVSTFGEKRYLRGVLIGGIVNVIAMVSLVKWGATGLAAALVLSQSFVMIYTAKALRSKFHHMNFPWKTGWIALFDSLVMAMVLYELSPYLSVWILIIVGMAVFAGLAILTRILTWADIQAILHS